MPNLREMREKLAKMRAKPITEAEQLANLKHETERICVGCGGHVEPECDCIDCGTYNPRLWTNPEQD